MSGLSRFLQLASRRIRDAAYAAGRESSGRDFIHSVDKQLRGQSKAVQSLWQVVRADLSSEANPSTVKQVVNARITAISDSLSQVWSDESLTVTAPDFPRLAASLIEGRLPRTLAVATSRYLQHTIELDEEAAQSVRKSQAVLDRRSVSLRWLVSDEAQRQDLRQRLEAALQDGRLKIETRHIATWGESGVPAVIYTGQMSRRDREGLIEAFDEMGRAVLVSTPAVEVGVDFKADVLVTEECDGNGFLQRFGRVGRTGDAKSQVIVLIREGETWVRLQQRSQPQMDRETFSRMVIDPDAPTDPNRCLFPDRTYAAGSTYLDATHWLVNRQLGRIGQRLNKAMFPDPAVADLGQQMESADVPFAYGLRGTLPGVSLLGGGGGSPFYVLSKVHDSDLAPSRSPFEVAVAQMGYTRFLYTPRRWNIRVDWERTMAASRAMFYWLNGQWRMSTGYGVAETFMQSFAVVPRFRNNLAMMRQQLANVRNPKIQAILRLGNALELHATPQVNLILGQGDIFLQRVERESGVSLPIEDRLGNPLVLPNQVWLYIQGDADKAWKMLQAAGLDNLSEIHYPQCDEAQVVLLDAVAGGCFYVYERLVRYAD